MNPGLDNVQDQMILAKFWGHPKQQYLIEVYSQLRNTLAPLAAMHHTYQIVLPPTISEFFWMTQVQDLPSFKTWEWN